MGAVKSDQLNERGGTPDYVPDRDADRHGIAAMGARTRRPGPLQTFRSTLQVAVLGLVVLVSLPMALQLWGQVSEKLLQLRSSEKDNVIWNLTQLEVEYLKFERSLIVAMQESGAQVAGGQEERLTDVRRRFDVYYSRLATLDDGAFYKHAFAMYGTDVAMHQLRTEIVQMAKVIDADDAMLQAALPTLLATQQARASMVRRIINKGHQFAGIAAQNARDDISRVLVRLSVVSAVSFVALALATLLLYRNSRWHRATGIEHRKASARFAAVIATSPDAVIVTDENAVIVEFNQAAEALFARDRQIVLGSNLKRYLQDTNSRAMKFPLALSEGGDALQGQVVCASGGLVPIELSQGRAEVEGRSFFVYFLRNISDRLAADQALLSSRDRALAGERAKSRFLAVMSHEMRTPLNGILGLVEVMQSNQDLGADYRRYLGLMRNSGQVLLGHVNDVLDIAKLEAEELRLNPHRFELDELIAELMETLAVAAETQGNSLMLEAPQQPFGWFLGDGNRLRQVLFNLMGNAIKFTSNGDVCLSVSLHAPTGASADQRDWVEFQVADTGLGIPVDDQDRIFEDFVRLDRDGSEHIEGTGLGLGIAKRIAEAMGGEIGVDSIEGEGSVFWLRIPMERLDSAEVAATLVKVPADTDPLQGITPQKILVVEDNPTNRLVVCDLLERDGHSVSEEVNGALGVERARREAFDVIFMDLNMPVMGGLEASRLIRDDSMCRDSKIVALTAHVMDRDDTVYRAAGMDAVLSKPLQWDDLRRALRGEVSRGVSSEVKTGRLDEIHLRKVLTALSPDKAERLMTGVRQEARALLQHMEASLGCDLTVGAHEALLKDVHAMAGSASMLGAHCLRNALNTLEMEMEEGTIPDLKSWLDELSKIWRDTEEALDQIKTP